MNVFLSLFLFKLFHMLHHLCYSVFCWSSTQPGNPAAWNPNNGLCVWWANRLISSSHMSFSTPPLDLNGDSFFLAAHATAKNVLTGGQQAANQLLLRTNLLRRVLEESACAYVGSNCSMNCPPTNTVDTQREGRKGEAWLERSWRSVWRRHGRLWSLKILFKYWFLT